MADRKTVKEIRQDLLNEFMVYLSPTMVVFLVAVFILQLPHRSSQAGGVR